MELRCLTNNNQNQQNQQKEQNQRNQRNRQQETQNPENTEFGSDFNEIPEDFQNPKQQPRRNRNK